MARIDGLTPAEWPTFPTDGRALGVYLDGRSKAVEHPERVPRAAIHSASSARRGRRFSSREVTSVVRKL